MVHTPSVNVIFNSGFDVLTENCVGFENVKAIVIIVVSDLKVGVDPGTRQTTAEPAYAPDVLIGIGETSGKVRAMEQRFNEVHSKHIKK